MANDGTFWVDEDNGVLIIRDDQGAEDKYIIEEELEIDENRYLILVPEDMVDDDDDDAEAFVLKIVQNGEEEEILSVVEDETEFEKVKEGYLAIEQ